MACMLASTAPLAGSSSSIRGAARRGSAVAAALPQRRRRQQRRCATRAAAQPEDGASGPAGAVQDLARSAERVLARYDFLSAGMGALLVTGFCVARGQDVGTALWITAAATVVAILVNDVLPEEH